MSKDDWKDVELQVGTPSMVLMPARNYAFKVSPKTYIITLPRKGEYHDIEPDLFGKEDGEFELFNARRKIMYLPAISKVLFAANKYPDLENHQLFAPISLVFKKDTVEISGQIINMVDMNKEDL
jgi:hypothetical protein